MIGQGREASKAHLAANPKLATEIELLIRTKAGLLGNSGEALLNGSHAPGKHAADDEELAIEE
jgi:hypothetical protein